MEISSSFFARVQLTISIGTGDDLALNRWQDITWTNDDQDTWHYMVSPGQND